jgi:hypothetical protein
VRLASRAVPPGIWQLGSRHLSVIVPHQSPSGRYVHDHLDEAFRTPNGGHVRLERSDSPHHGLVRALLLLAHASVVHRLDRIPCLCKSVI